MRNFRFVITALATVVVAGALSAATRDNVRVSAT